MDENAPRAALLFGVTGSGKTQVYLQLIAHALEQGKSAIVLVPEIGLTPQLLRQFAARFGEEVAVLHSALSAGERYDSFKNKNRKSKGGHRHTLGGVRAREEPRRYHHRRGAGRGVPLGAVAALPCAGCGKVPRGADERAARARLGNAVGRDVLRRKTGKIPGFRASQRFLGAGLPEVIISDMRGLAREGRSGIIGPDLERELIARSKRESRPSCSSTGAETAA